MRKIPNTVYYYLSYGVLPILGLVQTKILVSLLSPTEYGNLQLVVPLLNWFVIIGGLGAPQFVIRQYSKDGVRSFQESLFITIVSSMSIGIFLLIFITLFELGYANINLDHTKLGLFILAGLLLQIIALIKSLIRVEERHLLYNTLTVLAKILLVMGIVLVVLFHRDSIEGYISGIIVGSLPLIIISGILLKSSIIPVLKMPTINRVKQLVSYGLPISGIILMGDLLANVNRYIVHPRLGAENVAIYAIGGMIAALCMQLLYQPLNTILHPQVFKHWEGGDKPTVNMVLSKYLNFYIILALIALGLAIRLEDFLFLAIANASYQLPSGLFAVFLIANLLIGVYRFSSTHYYIIKDTLELGVVFLLSITINILIAVIFINYGGLYSAAAGMLFGSLTLVVVSWMRGRTRVRMKLQPRFLLPSFLLMVLLITLPRATYWEPTKILNWLDILCSILVSAVLAYFNIKYLNRQFS